jgi:predicted amino acid dehydrogenase
MPQQLNLLTNQVAQTLAQTSLVQEQTSTQQKQQVQLTAQTSLTGKQEGLVDEQVKAATYQYTTPTAGILYAQYSKHMEEVAVLTQKKITEEAQTVGNEGTVAGLIGKEMELKQNQADSFIRDAEQKSAKLYADVFQIMFSVNPDAGAGSASDPAFWGITGTDSNVIFDQLKSGVTTP